MEEMAFVTNGATGAYTVFTFRIGEEPVFEYPHPPLANMQTPQLSGALSIQAEDEQRVPRWDGDVLLAFGRIADGIGVDIAAGLEAPHQIAFFRVEREERAAV